MLMTVAFVILAAQPPVAAVHERGVRQASPASSHPERPWPPPGVSRLGPQITAPRLIRDRKPNYTADAMKAKIQGRIGLEVVVRADGTVGDVRVVRSLDKEHGLDDEAVNAVKEWRFAPGTKDGAAVPVLVEVEMTFVMRN
jgi:periplasmic protein TonB